MWWSVPLVQEKRGDQLKFGYRHREGIPCITVQHLICTLHFADAGLKVCPGDVLMSLSCIEDWLSADNAFPFDFANDPG